MNRTSSRWIVCRDEKYLQVVEHIGLKSDLVWGIFVLFVIVYVYACPFFFLSFLSEKCSETPPYVLTDPNVNIQKCKNK